MTDPNPRKAIVDKSADLMQRVQNGEITGEEAMREMLGDPQAGPFTL